MQEIGGVSRIYNETLPRICTLDPTISFRIILNNRAIQPLPRHSQISCLHTYLVDNIALPRHMWASRSGRLKSKINELFIGNSRNKVWHSTYYTLPEKWRGAIVTTVYDMIHERFADSDFSSVWDNEFRINKRNCILNADKVMAISQATKTDIQGLLGLSGEKIQVVRLGYNSVFKRIECPRRHERPYFLFVSGRAKYKNFRGLLQAYSRWKKNSSIDLVAVGSEWSEDEKCLIRELGIQDRVFIFPFPSDIILRDLYNHAVALVYPSLAEGFGIPLLEAMACGCPIIASSIPSTVEIACGVPYYHEPGNTEQMLQNLEQAFHEFKSDARVKSGSLLAQMYSWDQTATEVVSLYNSFS